MTDPDFIYGVGMYALYAFKKSVGVFGLTALASGAVAEFACKNARVRPFWLATAYVVGRLSKDL
jgi:hypothetical protein